MSDQGVSEKLKVNWGTEDEVGKLTPEAWAYFYSEILLEIVDHAEKQYKNDIVFYRLLKELDRI